MATNNLRLEVAVVDVDAVEVRVMRAVETEAKRLSWLVGAAFFVGGVVGVLLHALEVLS